MSKDEPSEEREVRLRNQREATRRYRLKHPDRASGQRVGESREDYLERERQRTRRRHKEVMADPERRKNRNARRKAWRNANLEKERERSRLHQAKQYADPEARKRLKKNAHKSYRRHAKRRTMEATIRRYGITEADYLAMLLSQGSVCAICDREERRQQPIGKRRLSVDHDHETGQIRGLLCSDCNLGLGKFGDDPDTLLRAVEYLRRADESKETG